MNDGHSSSEEICPCRPVDPRSVMVSVPLSKRITFTTGCGVFVWAGFVLTVNVPEVFLWGSSEAGCQRAWAAVTGSILAKRWERVRRYAQLSILTNHVKLRQRLQNSYNVDFHYLVKKSSNCLYVIFDLHCLYIWLYVCHILYYVYIFVNYTCEQLIWLMNTYCNIPTKWLAVY